ncbi:thiamine-phosphate pyrophosphorylase [Rhodobacteraceae bacterium THAF1]|uniref:thiamine phosphate synthase n=1 Tax=Palleronia sp. THAF1 TaxID=2587842 RepID=UPI000F3BB393|nr:thiamine phosphate synthase [Palleronia sp. THAF1]QFU08487.1 thiamine-phosphate pyrophosphorylase [Palleronia sp. THAF1]VDC29439.1 thiamine-phosphate pyrophosphorylase [Rhodobacteraceae bacterium THAF1]
MSDTSDDLPQLYLITPPTFDTDFVDALGALLDTHAVACLRLDLASRDEDRLMRAADALRAVTEPRDVALVMSDHWKLAERAGLDGVHLTDGSRSVKKARADLGADAIVGAFCGASRHDGMNAGEMGADYVSFGPVGGADLGEEKPNDELFQWWSEVIEVPVVAEGALDEEALARLSTRADFVAFGEEIWTAEYPTARLGELLTAMRSA